MLFRDIEDVEVNGRDEGQVSLRDELSSVGSIAWMVGQIVVVSIVSVILVWVTCIVIPVWIFGN